MRRAPHWSFVWGLLSLHENAKLGIDNSTVTGGGVSFSVVQTNRKPLPGVCEQTHPRLRDVVSPAVVKENRALTIPFSMCQCSFCDTRCLTRIL